MGDVTRPGDNPAGMLRDLAAKATPPPLSLEETYEQKMIVENANLARYQLEDLAPDLALLLADAMDALGIPGESGWIEWHDTVADLRARFRALTAPEETQT